MATVSNTALDPSKITPPWAPPGSGEPSTRLLTGKNDVPAAAAVPYPYPEQPGAQTPDPIQTPQVAGTETIGTDVPVPETSLFGDSQQPSPGPAMTDQNTDWPAMAGNAPGVTPEQTVQGQLAGLFSNKDLNPLWEHAEGLGLQYANTRGLANSSIAAEAGAQAVYAQAMPIAQQDANTYAARAQQEAQFWQTAGLQAQQGTIASMLAAQDHLQRLTEMTRQGDINSRLQLEQFGYNWQLNEQQNLHNMSIAALQGDIQKQLALQKFGFDIEMMKQDFGYRVKLQDIELRNALQLSGQENTQLLERMAAAHTNTLAEIQAASDARRQELEAQGQVNAALAEEGFARDMQQNYLLATERRTLQFSQEVTAIYTQQGLTAVQQNTAVAVARRNYESDMDTLLQFYAQSPYWDSSWTATPASTPTQPTAGDVMIEPGSVPYGGAGGAGGSGGSVMSGSVPSGSGAIPLLDQYSDYR